MKYDDPKLRELLASRYVLGTMPRRARARFERLVAADASFCAEVRDWAEMFAPLDQGTVPEAPPPRVWRAIEARLGPPARRPPRAGSRLDALWLWRGAAGVATAIALALLIYIGVAGVRSNAPPPTVVAILVNKDGVPSWIARAGDHRGAFSVAAFTAQPIDPRHSFELWAIAGGPPRPLGLLSSRPGEGLAVAAAAMPPEGGVLAVSLEPSGGSPTGAPTGPVLYQGKVFSNPL